MRTKNYFFLLLMCLACNLQAANTIFVKEMYCLRKQSISQPIMIDSVDVNAGKFNISNCLNNFTTPNVDDYTKFTKLQADTANLFSIGKAENKHQLQYFEFKIYASKFNKAKLHIASQADFKVYIDGIPQNGAPSNKLSLAKANEKTIDLNLLAQTYTIGIACLSKPNTDENNLKIGISTDKDEIQITSLAPGTKRKLAYPDIINTSSPYDVSISPKGNYYMTKISTTLPGGEKTQSMEIIERATGKSVYASNSRMDLAWMPQSELLYYVEKQGNNRILKTFNPANMEEKILAQNILDGWIAWSPTEEFIIQTVTDRYNAPEKDFKYYKLPNDRFAGWRNKSILYRVNLADNSIQQLTFGNQDMGLAAISPDGKKFIYRTSEITITKRPFSVSSYFEYNFETAQVDTIFYKQAFLSGLNYSPDGKKLLITGAPAAFNKLGENIGKKPYSNDFDTQAYLYDFASKKTDAITKNFDPTIQQAIWSNTSEKIYFKVVDKDYESVYTYDIANKTYSKLNLESDVVQQFSIDKSDKYAVYRGMSVSYPTKAYLLDLNSLQSKTIADPEKAKMENIALGPVQDYNFKSKDGSIIHGRYYLPADFDKNAKYPMIVYYYGGTTPTPRTFGSSWNFHYWASLGYVVYVVQPSGTIGFGQAFSAKHVNAWGDITSDDIIQGVTTFCDKNSFVDKKRIGCLGASYGGYMTMFLQTKTNIFATAISHAGISALSSYWGDGYWGYAYSSTATADTYPWSNPKYYTDHSPLFHANKINTPLLLLQGDVDTNVPPGESMQMYSAMKILGKEVAMVRVKNEDHIIMGYQHRIEWNYTIMAWMAKYLQSDSSWWNNMYPDAEKETKQ